MRVHYLTDISASGGKAYRSSGRFEGRDDDLRRPEVDDRTNSDLHREAAGTLTGEKERRQGHRLARPPQALPPGRLGSRERRQDLFWYFRRADMTWAHRPPKAPPNVGPRRLTLG